MKIIVTGAAGFMGSHLVDHLISQSHTVIGIDNLSGGFQENIHQKSQFYTIDLRNKNKVITLLQKLQPDLVYHLAADATEGRSQFTPILSTNNNYLAYLHVLVGSIKARVKKVVLVSSMSIYGNQSPPFSEELSPKPVDIYGISKAAMEEVTKIFSQVYGFEYVILRPHNVYGPRQNIADPYRNVIGIFINRLLQNKHFFIYGDGKQKRAFSYIDDVTPYIAKAPFLKETNGEIINIGPKEEHTINEIASEILSHFVHNINHIPPHLKPVYLPDRPQEVKNAFCTDEKARQLLGFKKQISLKEGIVRTIGWAKILGPQKFRYLKDLELVAKNVPKPWIEKLM